MTHRQPRHMSAIEATAGTAIGFVINVCAQIAVFPLVGIHVHMATNLLLAVLMTGISIARSYALRRFFDWLHHRQVQRWT